jgi:hypothetical protein
MVPVQVSVIKAALVIVLVNKDAAAKSVNIILFM